MRAPTLVAIGAVALGLVGCKELEPSSIAFTVPEKLNLGVDESLAVEIRNADNQPIAGPRLSFSVDPLAVGAVRDGRLRCLTEGKAVVTVSSGAVRESKTVECVNPVRVAREREAKAHLKALFVSQLAYFQEFDRLPSDLPTAGFFPEACDDGTRPAPPTQRWTTGCHFAYTVVNEGVCPTCGFTLTAFARGMGADEGSDWILRAPRDRKSIPPMDYAMPRRLEPSDGHLPLQ